ncbi:MAG: hypothetical protein H7070_08625 [Saprospiraceae bacterium]|nr:hypothetical protein [Pyrinomonadaceae bacterium]
MTAVFAGSLLGQKVERPDFTGIWLLNLKKSDSPMTKLYRGKLEKMERFASRLEINHKDPTIKLTETFMAEELDNSKNVIGTRAIGRISTVYNSDGKGETNKLDGRRDWGSKTEWKGNTIFVDRADLNAPINRTTLEFSLSKDGNELRITEKTFQKLPAVGFRENEIPSMGGKSIYIRYQPAVKVDK